MYRKGVLYLFVGCIPTYTDIYQCNACIKCAMFCYLYAVVCLHNAVHPRVKRYMCVALLIYLEGTPFHIMDIRKRYHYNKQKNKISI